jgi:hypothetical protein
VSGHRYEKPAGANTGGTRSYAKGIVLARHGEQTARALNETVSLRHIVRSSTACMRRMQEPGHSPHRWPAGVSAFGTHSATWLAGNGRCHRRRHRRPHAVVRRQSVVRPLRPVSRTCGRWWIDGDCRRAKSHLPRRRVTDGSPCTINARVIGGRGIALILCVRCTSHRG